MTGWSIGSRSWARGTSLAVVVGLVLALYAWTAATSVGPNLADRPATSSSLGTTDQPVDPSNKLADAFLHGRLDLGLPVPSGLRKAKNIHDVKHRGYLSSDYLDLSYDDGKFYSYWGPVPVLMLFVPARIVGLGFLSQALAVLLFASAAFLLTVALLAVLVRRFFPSLPHWVFVAAVLAIGTGNGALYALRRPEVYELALCAALCFAVAAVLCFVVALLRERPSARHLALGSLFAGLALGSRVPMALVLVGGLGVPAWHWRTGWRPGRREAIRVAAALLVPFVACAVGYGIYNAARFGSLTDFGNRHQLQNADVTSRHYDGWANLAPGLWYYVVALPRIRLQFPYVWLPPGPFAPVSPAGYGPVEPTAGILPTLPILGLLFLAPFALRRRAGELKVVVAALIALGLVLVFMLSLLFGVATMRYEVDFRTLLLVPALLTGFAVVGRRRRSLARRQRIAAATFVLVGWGVLASILPSLTGEKGRFAQLHPGTYGSLARFFSPLPTLATQIAGHPMLAAVGATPNVPPYGYDRLSIDGVALDVGAEATHLQVVAPAQKIYRLRARISRSAGVAASTRLLVGVSANRTGQYGAPGGDRSFPILLKQGLNEVRVEVAYDVRSVPADTPLVHLDEVRIR